MKLYKIPLTIIAFLALAAVFGPTIASLKTHRLVVENVVEVRGGLVGIGMRNGLAGFAINNTRQARDVYVCHHEFTNRWLRRDDDCPCPTSSRVFLGTLEPGERRTFSIDRPSRLGTPFFVLACTD